MLFGQNPFFIQFLATMGHNHQKLDKNIKLKLAFFSRIQKPNTMGQFLENCSKDFLINVQFLGPITKQSLKNPQNPPL
jgi:hypothetical protein